MKRTINTFHALLNRSTGNIENIYTGSHRRAIHSPKGFTLIEVLLSLTLLSVVLGAIYSSFFTVQRAIGRFDDVSLKYHYARKALDLMRREVEGAVFKIGKDTRDETAFKIVDRDLFGKHTSELSLTAFSFKGYTTNRISYFVKDSNGHLDLYKSQAPAGLETGEYSMEIVEGIEGFTVETLFNDRWVRTWDTSETEELPEILRIIIEFNDNSKTVKLTEYARPMMGKQL